MVELVIVDQGVEAILAAVPEVPEEGALMEQVAMLLEEVVAQPVFKIGFIRAGGGYECAFVELAQGFGQ